MGEIVNRIIDTLELKGGAKYASEFGKATTSAERHAKALKKAQATARTTGTAEYAARFREWDSQRKLSTGGLRRLRESRERPSTTAPMKGAGATASRLGIGGAFAAGFGPAAVSAAIVGVGMLAKASIEAAGATEKHRAVYNKATRDFKQSSEDLSVTVGNVLMPSFLRLAAGASQAFDTIALMIDKNAMEPREQAMAMPLDPRTPHGKAAIRARFQDDMGRKPKTELQELERARIREMEMIGKKAWEEFREGNRRLLQDQMRERDFQRNLQMERMIEAKQSAPASFKDLQKYVMGGGSQAGIGVTPIEMGYGPGGGGGSSSNPTLRVKFEGGANEMERAMGAALGKYFEMFLSQAIRQGQIQPGSSRH